MNNPQLTPAQMAEQTGVSIDTLRYYEKEGLLRNVAQASLIDHKLSFYAVASDQGEVA